MCQHRVGRGWHVVVLAPAIVCRVGIVVAASPLSSESLGFHPCESRHCVADVLQ